ncbi:MAG TPA: hypothetical protein VL574_06675 [Stellaceae bacterium]|nr:hypothetical protein [Stellaceae bacterium]
MDSVAPFIKDAPDNVLRMAEVSVGAFKGAYARKMTAFFMERNFFVLQVPLGAKQRMLIPRGRPVPQHIVDELTASGLEVVHF